MTDTRPTCFFVENPTPVAGNQYGIPDGTPATTLAARFGAHPRCPEPVTRSDATPLTTLKPEPFRNSIEIIQVVILDDDLA